MVIERVKLSPYTRTQKFNGKHYKFPDVLPSVMDVDADHRTFRTYEGEYPIPVEFTSDFSVENLGIDELKREIESRGFEVHKKRAQKTKKTG